MHDEFYDSPIRLQIFADFFQLFFYFCMAYGSQLNYLM